MQCEEQEEQTELESMYFPEMQVNGQELDVRVIPPLHYVHVV